MLTVGCDACFGGWGQVGILCGRGGNLGGQLTPFLFQACIQWFSCTSVCREGCTEVGMGLCGWAFAGSFPAAYGCFV